MALKKVLKTLDGVPAEVAKEYKQVGEEFHLDLDGDYTAEEIQRLNDKRRIEAEHRAKAEKLAEDRLEELNQMRRGAIPKADADALELSYKEKIAALEKDRDTRVGELSGEIMQITAGAAAANIAAEISTVPSLLEPIIRKRLTTEVVDGQRIVRVKDASGKPSAMTLDELKAELKGNTQYAAIIIGSRASGGAGGNGNGGAGNGGNSGGGATKKLHEMSTAERIEWAQRDPQGFQAAMGR